MDRNLPDKLPLEWIGTYQTNYLRMNRDLPDKLPLEWIGTYQTNYL